MGRGCRERPTPTRTSISPCTRPLLNDKATCTFLETRRRRFVMKGARIWLGGVLALGVIGAAVPGGAGAAVALPNGTTFVSDIPWTSATNGYGPVELNRSNAESAGGDG